jgi:putative nucleotidyltransferase with HDIG domain
MAKATKAKPSGPGHARSRREEIRRSLPRRTSALSNLLQQPEVASATLILAGLAAVLAVLVVWTAEHRLPAIGEIIDRTRQYRTSYTVEDPEATERARERARRSAPRVYRPNDAWLDELEAGLIALPSLLRGAPSLDEIDPAVRDEYALDETSFAALRALTDDPAATEQWTATVGELRSLLIRWKPILASDEFQAFGTTANHILLSDDGEMRLDPRRAFDLPRTEAEALELLSADQVSELVRRALFPPATVSVVVDRVRRDPSPSIIYDEAETRARQDAIAAATEPVMLSRDQGRPIVTRGDRLTVEQYGDLIREREQFLATAAPMNRWLPRIGASAMCMLLVAAMGIFLLQGYPRVFENQTRLLALAGLCAGMLAISCFLAVEVPQLAIAAAIGPTLVVAIVTLLAYDNRLALFLSVIQAIVATLALNEGVGHALVLSAGCGVAIVALREVRNRDSIIRAGIITAVVLALAVVGRELLVLPVVEGWGTVRAALIGGAWAAAASMTVAFLMLGVLPTLERTADITTGMTLAELRDPSRPLLRELQLRAPGTYNHSLQVATIAEAAADAIGANSLLLYVGALYHDVGKMNKPQYFVENQADGLNRHDKLRPAMSLLVIIGHVKDGIELAREYGLPRSIQHFIESHHGTTLVEYFYHAAREEAEADDNVTVDEVEYRYPGPRPRTKEAAILMLSDAVESATRAMGEPHPTRIEAVVRELSRKRLLDHQFDECPLTFRELSLIEDAMIARLIAIHHGRVKYPKGDKTSSDPPTSVGTVVAPDAAAPATATDAAPIAPPTPGASGPAAGASDTGPDVRRPARAG